MGLLTLEPDFELRLHHRSQMEAAGLHRIIELLSSFGVSTIDARIEELRDILEEDEQRLRERMNQEILQDLNNPADVYSAIVDKIKDTKAREYFLSMMQHMLLIHEDGAPMVHYFQLIDSLVTDVVLDKKLNGAEARLGHSVERIIAQFNEADRTKVLEDEAGQARSEMLRLKVDKENLEAEVAQGQEGLVGQLKDKVTRLEEKLAISREASSRLQGQLETQKAGYEEQIAQLEAQIMELFRMLKEVGREVNTILDNPSTSGMDRKTLVQTLEKHFQRDKTISILEGREASRRGKKAGQSGTINEGEDDEGDDDDDEGGGGGGGGGGAPSNGRRQPGKASQKRPKNGKIAGDETARDSQFMDVDDDEEQEQIQQQFENGPTSVSYFTIGLNSSDANICCSIPPRQMLEAYGTHLVEQSVQFWPHPTLEATDFCPPLWKKQA